MSNIKANLAKTLGHHVSPVPVPRFAAAKNEGIIGRLEEDVFHRTAAVSKQEIGTFEHFNGILEANKQSGAELYESLRTQVDRERLVLGKGGNDTVMDLPYAGMEEYVVKVPNGFEWPAVGVVAEKEAYRFTSMFDPFPNINVGQPIGHFGPLMILKKQHGIPGGVPIHVWQRGKGDPEAIYAAVKAHLERTSALPQQAFDELAQNVKTINGANFGLDSGKANNFLIDPVAQRFKLVDVVDNYDIGGNTLSDMLNRPLMANHFVYKVLRPETLQIYQQDILEKWIQAAVKEQIPYTEAGLADLEKYCAMAGVPEKFASYRERILERCKPLES